MIHFLTTFASMCWLALLIVFLIVEGVTATLVSLWFAAGALVALLLSLVTSNLWVQSFSFAIVSLVTLVIVRPIARQLLKPKGTVATNADRLIGKVAMVTETIDELAATGQVKIGGQMWSARTVGGEIVPARRRVTVLSIEGVKLIVEPIAHEAAQPLK